MHSAKKSINYNTLAFLALLILVVSLVLKEAVSSKDILPSDNIKLKGKIIEDKDISAVGFVAQYMLLGSDEGNTVQVLKPNRQRSKYQVIENIQLGGQQEAIAEVDIEGIAVAENKVYVVGSHSVKETASNIKQSAKASRHQSGKFTTAKNERKKVFSFELNPNTGKLDSTINQGSLQKILEQDQILSPYLNISYEENGIDIEGIAVKGDLLYFGFRTPVLEEDYVPVIAVKFQELTTANPTQQYELFYLNLQGNGIRDMVAVDEGFLILADRTGENKNNYQVYFWDGSNSLPSANNPARVELLSKIPADKNTRAEGITILKETDSNYQALIVYDGVKEGEPTVVEIEK